jgi:hypothetical protein
MWTSYEALCEMGAVDIDPTSVFGVRPTELDQVHQHLHKPQNMPLQEKNVLQSSFFSQAQQTPMEAVRTLQPMDLGTPSSIGSSIPKTSLFQTAPKRSTTKGTTLHFDTPNLTPIPMQSQDASFAANPPDSYSFADSTNPNTINRAKNVAARLYYQLSPETPDSAQLAPSSRYLRGMDRSSSLLFGDVEGTPLRRGGRQDNSGIHQPSTARKPRALFMMSENKNINNPEEDDQEDQEGQSDHADPNVQQPQQQQEDEKPIPTSNVHPEEPEDGMDNHQAVQAILENLCMMGAAFWRLCQVCIQNIGNMNSLVTNTRLPLFPTRFRSIAVEKPCSCSTSSLMPNITLVGFCIRKEEPISKWRTIRTRNVVWSSCSE